MTNAAPGLFSVLPAGKPQDLPEPINGPYFIYDQEGWSVHRNFHWGRLIARITKADPLDKQEAYLWPLIELPIHIVGQAWSFFRAVYERDRSEAMVDITWDNEKGYRLFVPEQSATGGGVHAKRKIEQYRGQIVGTIHSHCMMSAFHSHTDTNDADEHDGLHITLGKVMNDKPEIAIMISAHKQRWHFKPEELWEPAEIPLVLHPDWWMRYVNANKGKGKSKSNGKTTSLVVHTSQQRGKQHQSVIRNNGKTVPTRDYHKYYSIDELLWRRSEYITAEEETQLNAINELIEEIIKHMDRLGYDLDYEIEVQAGRSSAKNIIIPNNRLEEWEEARRMLGLDPSEEITREALDQYFGERGPWIL